jgi:hypothetical protein
MSLTYTLSLQLGEGLVFAPAFSSGATVFISGLRGAQNDRAGLAFGEAQLALAEDVALNLTGAARNSVLARTE